MSECIRGGGSCGQISDVEEGGVFIICTLSDKIGGSGREMGKIPGRHTSMVLKLILKTEGKVFIEKGKHEQ